MRLHRKSLGIAGLFVVLGSCRENDMREAAHFADVSDELVAEKLLVEALANAPAVPTGDTMPPSNTPALVTVLSAGPEPRTELHWVLKPGTFDVASEDHEDFFFRNQWSFSVTQRMRLNVQIIVDGPKANAKVSITDVSRDTRGEVPPAFSGRPSQTGRTFVIPLSPGGSDGVVPTDIGTDDGVDGLARTYRSIQSLWVPMPSGPVGEGAEWQVLSSRQEVRGERTITQEARHKWVATDEGRGRIVASISGASSSPLEGEKERNLRRRAASIWSIDRRTPLALWQSYRSITESAVPARGGDVPFFRSEGRGTIRVTPVD